MQTEIVVLDVSRRTERGFGPGAFPAWAPDGRSLAYIEGEVVKIVDRLSGREQRTVKPDAPYDVVQDGLTWSPDGDQLAYGFDDPQETFPLTHIAVVSADGTDAFRLTLPTGFPDRDPDWQPLCTVYGSIADDVLIGTPGDDLICGLRGNDRIRGLSGNDVILGGDGDDVIVGGSGADWLFGAAGDDRTYALDNLADVVNGGPGADRAWVDDGLDTTSETEQVARRR